MSRTSTWRRYFHPQNANSAPLLRASTSLVSSAARAKTILTSFNLAASFAMLDGWWVSRDAISAQA
jgi:hypothetical protein